MLRTEQLAAVRLAMALYGGSVTSRLFLNVRERDHLCYYCSFLVPELYCPRSRALPEAWL